jgi:hypothetical protein
MGLFRQLTCFHNPHPLLDGIDIPIHPTKPASPNPFYVTVIPIFPGSGIFTSFPFVVRDTHTHVSFSHPHTPLRTDSPVSKHCSHGTFLLFSLQCSLLNICYYHQDLHQRPIQERSPSPFHSTPAPSYWGISISRSPDRHRPLA